MIETLSQCSSAQKKYEQRLLDFNHKDVAKRSEDFRKTKEAMIAMVTGLSDVSDAKKVAEQLCLIEMVRRRLQFALSIFYSRDRQYG